jgi:hypothetical protein
MSVQPETLEFTLRSSIFDRPRKLTIHPEYLEFDDKDGAGAMPTRFEKEQMEGLRYGTRFIEGYSFVIGRIFCVDIRSRDGQIIKLRLKSLYRIRRKQLAEKYSTITNAVYKYYFHDVIRQYLTLLDENQSFKILGVSIDAEGVLFDKKVGRVSWDFLGVKRYWRYFTLFSETNPNEYKAYEFLEHWNAGILYGLVESVLKQKFPKRKV